ncbi:MAG: TetR/AcrR family transcriptional regulator [Acidimicrobiales bacterium]|nr:TetR/AcrR family transcriptional regulator [Hyphomonadaceae bacterium]RZV44043.1 MAG: TetR/AcrR family transcriptional regulator [Acidimicrobiales bacterium]
MATQLKHDAYAIDAARGVSAADGTTKARIERAALILFTERGVDGVSIKEVAARAKISDGAMYRYYPSKYKLAHELMLTIHNRLTALVREVAGADLTFHEKIKAIVTQYCALADDDWDLFAYHLMHLHHFPELFALGQNKKKMDSATSACADILDQAMRDGDIPTGNTELLASMVLGIVVQAAQAKAYQRLNGPLSIYVNDFERSIRAVLQAQ